MHAQRSFATRQKTTLHFNKNVNARWRFMSVVFKTTLKRQEWRWSGLARRPDSDGRTARRGTSDGPKVRVEGARGNQIKITMFIRRRNRTGKVKNRNGQVVFCGLRERLSESEKRVAEGPDGARGRGRARSGPRRPHSLPQCRTWFPLSLTAARSMFRVRSLPGSILAVHLVSFKTD